MIEKNAIIKSVSITNDAHNVLMAWVMLDYGGIGQGFGGYILYSTYTAQQQPGNYAGIFIWRCMEIAGVKEWSKMVGKAIRVRKENELDTIKAIGHIIEDKWFYPEKEFLEIESRFAEKAQ